jgi:proton-translocating NADH-quinone oxidoreductase chain N
MPSLLILLPLVVLVVFNFPFGKRLKSAFFWVALAIFFIDVAFIIIRLPSLHIPFANIDAFFAIDYEPNALSFIVLLCIGIISFASLLVAKSSTLDKEQLNNFINLVMVASIGMNGIVLAKDIFTLYIYIEITSIASFILVALKKDLKALDGSFKYILLSAVASILMLLSVAIFFLLSQSTSYDAITSMIKGNGDRTLIVVAVFCFTAGLLIKGGLMPFHGWLPDAYSFSSSPVSVFLSGIVTKVCGAYALIRLYSEVFGFYPEFKTVLLGIGIFSIVVAAFAALGQNKYKRMFAFSSISQVGFIVVGLGTGTQLGIIGAIFHLFNHSMFKSLLFVNASAIELRTNEDDMTKLGGLGKRMPVTSVTSMIASLSAAGIPPLAGFWSKLIIVIALWTAGYYWIAIVAVCASVVTLGYLLLFQRKTFFGKFNDTFESIKEAPAGIIVASIVLASLCIAAGIIFPLILDRYGMPIFKLF